MLKEKIVKHNKKIVLIVKLIEMSVIDFIDVSIDTSMCIHYALGILSILILVEAVLKLYEKDVKQNDYIKIW